MAGVKGKVKRGIRAKCDGRSVRAKRGISGFSMVEMLAALLIVTLVSVTVAAGVPAAQKAYLAAMDASNAQILLSTTTTRLRDVLSSADPGSISATPETGTLAEFTSNQTGLRTVLKNGDDGLVVNESVDAGVAFGKAASSSGDIPLVSLTATAGTHTDLRTRIESIDYDDGVFTVSGLHVTRDGEDFEKAQVDELKIRVLAAQV